MHLSTMLTAAIHVAVRGFKGTVLVTHTLVQHSALVILKHKSCTYVICYLCVTLNTGVTKDAASLTSGCS